LPQAPNTQEQSHTYPATHTRNHQRSKQMAKQPWHSSSFVRTSLPMFGFVLICWYGLEQLMSSKLKIRVGAPVRGFGT